MGSVLPSKIRFTGYGRPHKVRGYSEAFILRMVRGFRSDEGRI